MNLNLKNVDEVYNDFYPKVYGYFLRRVNNKQDVEDLRVKTLTKFFVNMLNAEKRSKIESPLGYLWKISSNSLIDFIHSKSAVKNKYFLGLDENNDYKDPETTVEYSITYKDGLQRLDKCIKNQLKEKDRFLVEALILEERKAVEVALEIGIKA
jgi:RNA polymerase sigma factor (sigma-70 family)